MTKTFKKAVSMLLTIVMIISVFTIVPLSASAAPADFSTDLKAIFLTDSLNWDYDGVPYVHYWKITYPAPSYEETVVDGDWVAMTWQYDNGMGQSVYSALIPDDATWVEFNVNTDASRQTSATRYVYNGSWWYVDGNKDCQFAVPTTSSTNSNAGAQIDSLSDAFVTNSHGADRFFVIGGKDHVYYIDPTTNTLNHYDNPQDLYVAKVVGGTNDGNWYFSVDEAIAAAGDGGRVELVADIKSNVMISESNSVTLDLAGHTITNTSGSGITIGATFDSTLTIEDSSDPSTGAINSTKKYTGDACVSDSSGATVVINGGTFTSNGKALYVSSDEGWTINGGTFNGDVYIKSNADITDGTFNGDIVAAEGPADYSQPYPWPHFPSEVEISGGTFTGDITTESATNEIAISGGTFTTANVSAYTTELTYQDETGAVVPRPMVVKNETTDAEYVSIAAAVAAASDGDTIILLADVTVDSQINIDKDITIDGDGNTITCTFADTYADHNSFANGAAFQLVGTTRNFTITDATLDGNNVGTVAINAYRNNGNSGNVITLDNVTVENFIGYEHYGAIKLFGYSNLVATDCTFTGNTLGNNTQGYAGGADIWAGGGAHVTLSGTAAESVGLNGTTNGGASLTLSNDSDVASVNASIDDFTNPAVKITISDADSSITAMSFLDTLTQADDTRYVASESDGTTTYTLFKTTKVAAVDPTFDAPGNTEYYVGNDGKYYSDAAGENEITLDDTVVPALVAVAQNMTTGTKYTTFAAAIDGRESNDEVIKLLANVDSTPYTMTLDQVIKINKNSKKFTLNAPAGAYATTYTYASSVYTYSVVEAVASLTKGGVTTYYDSVYNAFGAATKQWGGTPATQETITLLQDSTESAINVGSKTNGVNVAFDLGGNTLTLNGSGNTLVNINGPSSLDVSNGTVVFEGTGTNPSGFALVDSALNAAALTIEDDVVVEAKGNCSAVTVTGGTLTTEGTLTSENSPAIATTTLVANGAYDINVTGGTITSTNSPAIYQVASEGTVTISGGTISGVEGSDNEAIHVSATAGATTITGGTFNSDVSDYVDHDTLYQNADGTVVTKAANTIYEDCDFAKAAVDGGDWTIVADVSGDGVTVTASDLKIFNTTKNTTKTISGDITVADGASMATAGKGKVAFSGTVTLNGGSINSGTYSNIIVANDPYVHGQIVNVASGAIIKDGDGKRIVYDAISLTYAAKNGSEVYLVDDIADMYMTMNVNSGTFILHGDGHTVNFTISGNYGSALGKDASIEIEDLDVTVASGKALKSFIKANSDEDNTGSVSIDNVTAQGFSTDAVYTGGGEWTFANTTVTSATEPECPQDWKAVDNNDGTWTIVAKDYVAQVGDDKYEDIADAINAAIGEDADSCGTVYLLKEFTSTITFTPASAGVFKVYGNGFYGLSKIKYPDSIIQGTTPYTMSYVGGSTGKTATRTYTIVPAVVEVERADGTKVYPNALYQALAGTVGGGRAQTGDTVRLLDDIDLDAAKGEIKVTDTGVILDLNGKELTGAREGFLEVKTGNTLTIENGTLGGTGSVKVGEGSTLELDDAIVSAPITAGADATLTFENGAGVTGDIDVPAGYEVVTNETTGTKTVQPSDVFALKHSISLEGNIELNYYLNPTLVEVGDVINFNWTVNGTDKSQTYTLTAGDLKANGYKVAISMPAAEMTYDVTITVEGKDTLTDTYSVRDYCNVILSDEYEATYTPNPNKPWQTYDNLEALTKAMLDYGSMAQIAFNRTDVELANGGTNYNNISSLASSQYINEAIYDAFGSLDAPVDFDEVAMNLGAHYYNTSMFFLDKSTIRHYFTPMNEQVGGMYNAELYSGNQSEYYYYVEVANIAAAELDVRKLFKVGDVEFYYSGLDYIKSIVDGSSTEKAKNLAKATFLYNQAANAFFDDPTA